MNSNLNLAFRVIFESRENYRVMNENQQVFPASIVGKLRQGVDVWPAVGDWVNGEPQPGGWVLITGVRTRKSILQRKDPGNGSEQVLAANVDVLFIVTSANQDLSLNRLDRYVVMAVSGNIRPVILINKIDLVDNPDAILGQVARRFSNIDIIGMSAKEGLNLDRLDKYTQPGQTVALVGSSGVGKSTVCNALLGGSLIDTGEIREDDGRGRHTTTHRELHVTTSGAVLIDSPGIRLVGLAEEADLGSAFGDIEELALSCKFTDCQHATEPGCAIRSSLESGALDTDRWESYLKLGKELAHEQRKSNKELQSQTKKKWAKINAQNRARMKSRGR